MEVDQSRRTGGPLELPPLEDGDVRLAAVVAVVTVLGAAAGTKEISDAAA